MSPVSATALMTRRESDRARSGVVAVQLHGLQVRFIRCGFYLVAPGVDEHADSGHRRQQRVHNRPRPKRRDRARARRPEDEADRRRAEAHGQPGVFRPRDAADLHDHAAPPAEQGRQCRPGSGVVINRSPMRKPVARLRQGDRDRRASEGHFRHREDTARQWRGQPEGGVHVHSSVRRFRLFTPTSVAPASSARSSSRSSCTSTSTSRCSASADRINRRMSASLRAATMSSTASAPEARASTSWYSSTMKSLRSTGTETAGRTASEVPDRRRRTSVEHRYRRGASTLVAGRDGRRHVVLEGRRVRAIAVCTRDHPHTRRSEGVCEAARRALHDGSGSSDGHRARAATRVVSRHYGLAATVMPAACSRGDADHRGERAARVPMRGRPGHPDAISDRTRTAGDEQARRRVEQHHAPRRPVLPVQNAADNGGVHLRVATLQLLRIRLRDAEVRRVDVERVDRPVAALGNLRVAGCRDLIEPVGAVDDPHALDPSISRRAPAVPSVLDAARPRSAGGVQRGWSAAPAD